MITENSNYLLTEIIQEKFIPFYRIEIERLFDALQAKGVSISYKNFIEMEHKNLLKYAGRAEDIMLAKELENTKIALNSLQMHLETSEISIKNIEIQKKNLQELYSHLRSATLENQSLLQSIQKNERELEELKQLALSLAKKNAEYKKGTIQFLKEAHQKELKALKERHEEQMRELLKENQSLKEQLRNSKIQKDISKMEDIGLLKKKINDLKAQLEISKMEKDNLENSKNGLRKKEIEDLKKKCRILENENDLKDNEISKIKFELEEMKMQNELLKKEKMNDALHVSKLRILRFKIQQMKGNIRVVARIRPRLENERSKKIANFIVDDQDNKITIIGKSLRVNKEVQKQEFQLDRVFGQDASQADIFEEVAPLVHSALDGYKVCLFAYGQTGSGKTHTMIGDESPDKHGIIPKSVEYLFKEMKTEKEKGWEYELVGSFLEIYNNEIRDLLKTSDQNSDVKHEIENSKGETKVRNLTYYPIKDSETIYKLLARANKHRAIGETSLNKRSSRSHSVFTLSIKGKNFRTMEQSNGILNIIDLAGSERLTKSRPNGIRLRETQHINKSLSNLGDVIHSIGNKSTHIPYRNSKLTFLLKNWLNKDCKVLMIVNISPLEENVDESICSLRFAKKVNSTILSNVKRK